MESFKELETVTATNTAIAATATEYPITGTQRVMRYNRLLVVNRDVVDIRVYLNGDPTRYFDVQNTGGVQQIEPNDGVEFTHIQQQNLDAAVAQTAGKITFRVSYAVEI